MSTLAPLELLDVMLVADESPETECMERGCSNVALWRLLFSRPCGCGVVACQTHTDWVEYRNNRALFLTWECDRCHHMVGRYAGKRPAR